MQYHAEGTAQVRFFDFIDVDAVVTDFTVGNVIKTVNQVGNSGLARTGGADKGNLFTGVRIQGNVMQNFLVGIVTEVHMVQYDFTPQAGIGNGAVVVGMLPCPDTGVTVGFGKGTIFAFHGIYQGNITFVGFGRLVHESENTGRTGKSRDNGVILVGNLGNRLGKVSRQRQERSNHTDGHGVEAGQP